ncbi:hypothetical protein [Paenibacillus alkalitolerans]|nr:hypothetical protein [Paenibacillus alkalitolerans]
MIRSEARGECAQEDPVREPREIVELKTDGCGKTGAFETGQKSIKSKE